MALTQTEVSNWCDFLNEEALLLVDELAEKEAFELSDKEIQDIRRGFCLCNFDGHNEDIIRGYCPVGLPVLSDFMSAAVENKEPTHPNGNWD